MHIAIDIRCFAAGKNTGVEEYAKNFLSELFAQTSTSHTDEASHTFVLFFNAYNDTKVDLEWATVYKHVSVERFHFSNKLLNLAFWYLGYPRIDRLLSSRGHLIDVLFMPNPGFYALNKSVPLMLTIHDLVHEYYPETFSLKQRIWHWAVNPRKMCSRAGHIITVSESTRHDIIKTYKANPDKITTLHNGPTQISGTMTRNAPELLTIKDKYKLPYKYIFYFGTVEPRKNIQSIISAYNALRSADKSITHSLLIAGAKGWHIQQISQAIKSSPFTKDIIVHHDIPSFEREALYVMADVFVYPTFYEGFGFPALEAILSHTPVITSHTTSLPEVVSNGAIMIDPTRPEELTSAITEVIKNRALHTSLTRSRDEKSKDFVWNKGVKKFMKIMESN